jgi:hypothetical protein
MCIERFYYSYYISQQQIILISYKLLTVGADAGLQSKNVT